MTTVLPARPGRPRPGTVSMELRRTLASLLAQVQTRDRPTLVSAVLRVPSADALALYASALAIDAAPTLWLRPGASSALLGVGSAWSFDAHGPGRFAAVARAWDACAEGAIIGGTTTPRGTGPILLGGFGFTAVRPASSTWHGFEPASFVLPGLLLTVTPDGTWLTASGVVTPGDRVDDTIETLDDAWQALADGARAAQPTPTGRDTLRIVARRPEAAAWRDSVARLAGAVGRGRLDKVVLARQVDLEAGSAIDIPAVLERLRSAEPESTTFAVTREGRTFLGATPERLIGLRGRDFETMALAGSSRRGSDPASDERVALALRASDKEREEHAVVVTALQATLAPIAERLSIPREPGILRLRHIQHLVTPVQGRLREPLGVLQLVERLHPTPAVGGIPRDLALELLAEEEPTERGWYAGPLGWLDRHGDGEFVVALRSGVVAGRTAALFAGCGIVADSEPEREWQESTTKLLALGSALGRVDA